MKAFFVNRPKRAKTIHPFEVGILVEWDRLAGQDDLSRLLIDIDWIELVWPFLTIGRPFSAATPAACVSVLPFRL
jgi:hypothetical protein